MTLAKEVKFGDGGYVVGDDDEIRPITDWDGGFVQTLDRQIEPEITPEEQREINRVGLALCRDALAKARQEKK